MGLSVEKKTILSPDAPEVISRAVAEAMENEGPARIKDPEEAIHA